MLDALHMTNESVETAPRDRWLAIGAIVVLMVMVLRNAWVTEDAYLTLRTIDNWVSGFGLRWNVDERVQAYTHPLWLLLLTGPYLILRDAYAAALVSGLVVTFAAVIALVYLARTSSRAVAAVVLLMLSRSFIDYSTAGLENPLSHLLLAGLVWLYAVKEARLLPVALCASLLALNRSDALILALPALAHTTVTSLRARGVKQTAKELALGLSPLLAWELFSLFYYGLLVPNTALAKLNTGVPRGDTARQGLTYLLSALAWDPALWAGVTIGVSVALVRRQWRTGLLAAGVFLYVLYVIQVGGDFMKGRFLTMPLFLAICLFAVAPVALSDWSRMAQVLLPAGLLFLHPSATDLHHAYAGVEDEREFYEDSLGLTAYTRTTAVPHHIFRDNGLGFAANAAREPVREGYNVGLTGFYAGPKVHIVDSNALSEPLLSRLPIRYDPHWRIGHYTRVLPEGYLETVRTGSCKMRDAHLCTYYAKLKEIIAGDLWSWSRLKSIVAMNLGYYDGLIDRDRYRFPGVEHAPLQALAVPLPEEAKWNDPRARIIPSDGIEIELGRVVHAPTVSISFDGNDTYEVHFKRGGVEDIVTSPSQGAGGMRTRMLRTPAEATKRGFDRLTIRPLQGDGMYSVGNVRLGS